MYGLMYVLVTCSTGVMCGWHNNVLQDIKVSTGCVAYCLDAFWLLGMVYGVAYCHAMQPTGSSCHQQLHWVSLVMDCQCLLVKMVFFGHN